MDMYTFFSLMMFTLTLGALLLAVLNFGYARREIATHRQFIKLYFERAVEEYTEHKKLQATLTQTLAQRITALETYRRHHTERLNAFDEELAQLDMLVNDYLDEQQSGLELESDALARRSGEQIFTGSTPMPETMIDHAQIASDCIRARGSWDSVHVDVDDYHDSGPGTTIDAMGYFHSALERQRAALAAEQIAAERDTLPGL